jgi:hypothetical protein
VIEAFTWLSEALTRQMSEQSSKGADNGNRGIDSTDDQIAEQELAALWTAAGVQVAERRNRAQKVG